MDCPNFDSLHASPPNESCAECGDDHSPLFSNAERGNAPLCWNCVAERNDVGELVLAQDSRPTRPLDVTVDLATLPADITSSIRTVLESHGLVLVPATSILSPCERSESVLRELGNNVAQIIACAEKA